MENNIINKMLTKDDLVNIFRKVGISNGMIVEVHSSMSQMGFIIGGAQTFNDALIETLGYNGTIIMPLQCSYNEEPSLLSNPPISFDLYKDYRKNYPAFDPLDSEATCMGKIVENLRRREKTIISYHPNCAFVAIGKYAKLLCNYQNLEFPFDDSSPLGRLYELKASCFLVGVDYSNMTSLHLAEYKSEVRPISINGAAIKEASIRKWEKYLEYDIDSSDGFNEIGERLEKKGLVNTLELENAKLKLLRVDVAIDEGIAYYKDRMKYYN